MTLGVSPITGTIYSGRVKGDMWVGKKEDVTSDFLRCVLEKAMYHGGSFDICGGGKRHIVTVVEENDYDLAKRADNGGQP